MRTSSSLSPRTARFSLFFPPSRFPFVFFFFFSSAAARPPRLGRPILSVVKECHPPKAKAVALPTSEKRRLGEQKLFSLLRGLHELPFPNRYMGAEYAEV